MSGEQLYRYHLLPPQPWELAVVDATGQTFSFVRFGISFLASVLVGIVFRFVPTPKARHWYALITGFLLIYYPFGNGCFHAFVPSLLTYIFMARFRHHCGTLTWLVAFPYLIINHVMLQSGTAWQEGHLDFTAAQMVLTLKLVSIAMCFQDGARDDAAMREYARGNRLTVLPSLLEYFSYLFAAGNLLAGPFFESSEYFHFVNRTGEWDQSVPAHRLPNPLLPGLARMAKAVVCVAVWSQLTAAGFNEKLFLNPWWQHEVSLAHRIYLMWATVVVMRFKYYGAWAVAESALIFSGQCFEGYTEGGRAKWHRYTNARIIQVELNPSVADTPRHWNACTGKWLRHYVYERLTPPGGKPGLRNMVVTQLVSGVWHGLFPGYWLFFISSAFFFHTSKVIYRYEQSWPARVRSFPPWTLFKIVANAAVLNYGGAAFMVLTWSGTIQAWRSVYFFGHAVVGCLLLVAAVLPPRSSSKQRRAKLRPEAAAAATGAAGGVEGGAALADAQALLNGKVDGKVE